MNESEDLELRKLKNMIMTYTREGGSAHLASPPTQKHPAEESSFHKRETQGQEAQEKPQTPRAEEFALAIA